jgi:hypothetical protein
VKTCDLNTAHTAYGVDSVDSVDVPIKALELPHFRDAYLQIMDRGKRLISYKMMKERGKRAVMTQMSGIAEVEAYLKKNEAELVENAG